MNEINTLAQISNPHIVKFVEMIKTLHNYYFVYEFCNGGTLEKVLYERGHFTEEEALGMFRQLLIAFKTLVEQNIVHR